MLTRTVNSRKLSCNSNPHICEGNPTWKGGLYKYNQDKIRSLGLAGPNAITGVLINGEEGAHHAMLFVQTETDVKES